MKQRESAGVKESAGEKESVESVRCEGWGRGFIAPPGLPYKEENAGSAVIGVQGLRVSS